MKLLSKYNSVNIPITVATLLISSIGYYFILHYVLVHQLDKDLKVEQNEIFHDLKETGALPETTDYKDQQVEFTPSKSGDLKERFSNENIYNKADNEEETFRRLDFTVSLNGKYYLATVRKSQQETEDIVRLILIITFSVIAFLLIILSIANRFLLGKLWKPFNNTLEQLKQFNLTGKNKIALQQTDVDEFGQLNKTVASMTQKVVKDYESIKSFTENASHEIQTPLAIIKTKLELLSQSENLDETQVNTIQSLNEATTRLSKLNQSLLLLTKIENKQFTETEKVNISTILHRYIENFEELAATKNISIKKNIACNIFVQMNESLAETLISNILINAIKHNYKDGNIEIELINKSITISNTGSMPSHEPTEFFDRFKKDSSANDSLGLGLSIVKKICDTYDFTVSYDYADGKHIVSVQF
jgi:signal transduction histidine kinase